jgi:hypothetical protein
MKVIGYFLKRDVSPLVCPVEVKDWLPAIPCGLVTDATPVWRDKNKDEHDHQQQNLSEPVEVPEGSWIGIETNGSATILSASSEFEWCVSRATRAIEEARAHIAGAGPKASNALRGVYAMHAAAFLVGIRVPDFITALGKVRKTPFEPLEVTVRALASELAKRK